MKTFFSIAFVLYIVISFIALLILITDRLTFWDNDTKEKFIIQPKTKVALAIYWPVLFYIIYRSIKLNKEN